MSRKSSAGIRILFVALAATLAGCSDSDKKPKDKDKPVVQNDEDKPVVINSFTDEELYTNIPDDKLKYGENPKTSDKDIVFPPDKDSDPIEVAEWVKSRKQLVEWCYSRHRESNSYTLNEHSGEETTPFEKVFDDPKRPETRLDQAIAIAMKVIDKVPETPLVRLRLAQMCFNKGSYYFWLIDAAQWEVQDALDSGKPERAQELQKQIEHYRKAMIAYHIVAMRQFQAYEQAMPMHHPTAYYFKINFQLGNFKESLRFLEEILDNPDLTSQERSKYEALEKDIRSYLADRAVDEAAPKPGTPERVRKTGGKRTSPDGPG